MGRAGGELHEEEQNLLKAFHDVYLGLSAVLSEQLLNDSSLSSPEFAVLNHLLSDTDRPGMRIRELCSTLMWDQSRVSHIVVRMEKRGLVTRHRCDDDGRGTEVRATNVGRAARDDAAPKYWDATRRYFLDALSPTDRAALMKMLERALDYLNRPERDR